MIRQRDGSRKLFEVLYPVYPARSGNIDKETGLETVEPVVSAPDYIEELSAVGWIEVPGCGRKHVDFASAPSHVFPVDVDCVQDPLPSRDDASAV